MTSRVKTFLSKYDLSSLADLYKRYSPLNDHKEQTLYATVVVFVCIAFNIIALLLATFLSKYGAVIFYSVFIGLYFYYKFLLSKSIVFAHALICTILTQVTIVTFLFNNHADISYYYFPCVLLPCLVFPDRGIQLRSLIYFSLPCFLYFGTQSYFLAFDSPFFFSFTEQEIGYFKIANKIIVYGLTTLPFIFIIFLKGHIDASFRRQLSQNIKQQNIIGLGSMYDGATVELKTPLSKMESLINNLHSLPTAKQFYELNKLADQMKETVASLRFFSRNHRQHIVNPVDSRELCRHIENVFRLQLGTGFNLRVINAVSEDCHFRTNTAHLIQALIELCRLGSKTDQKAIIQFNEDSKNVILKLFLNANDIKINLNFFKLYIDLVQNNFDEFDHQIIYTSSELETKVQFFFKKSDIKRASHERLLA